MSVITCEISMLPRDLARTQRSRDHAPARSGRPPSSPAAQSLWRHARTPGRCAHRHGDAAPSQTCPFWLLRHDLCWLIARVRPLLHHRLRRRRGASMGARAVLRLRVRLRVAAQHRCASMITILMMMMMTTTTTMRMQLHAALERCLRLRQRLLMFAATSRGDGKRQTPQSLAER